MKRRLHSGDTSSAPKKKEPAAPGGDRSARRQEWDRQMAMWKEWARIHVRRWVHIAHGAMSSHRAVGPISFLGGTAALGVALVVTTLYSPSYAVTMDGQTVGVVADQAMVAQAIHQVEEEGSSLLGYDYQVEGDLDYQFTLTLKSDLSSKQEIENYFYGQLSDVSSHLRKSEVVVNGRSIGVVKDEAALNQMLQEMKDQYVTENTTSVEFMEEVKINDVYAVDTVMTIEEMRTALQSSAEGETTYTVEQGDTFNGIAYANDMAVSDLKALNPDVNINRLMVGDVLNVKELIPVLSVRTTEHVVYTQSIECPVEKQENSSMYKGDTKVITQGVEGEERVEADVVNINGYEKDRTILSTTTLREPTTTVMAVGTKEKPKTASKGSYRWPVSGRITSYFGGRHIFGRYSYHSGLDIACSYGTPIKAADGGTVTFAGNKGSYGKLVIITHDNGTQTYYAHNSSLLVSAGDKVYQGQSIAKAGSTGRSTGVHCHFEVRVRGTAVNPLNYLR